MQLLQENQEIILLLQGSDDDNEIEIVKLVEKEMRAKYPGHALVLRFPISVSRISESLWGRIPDLARKVGRVVIEGSDRLYAKFCQFNFASVRGLTFRRSQG